MTESIKVALQVDKKIRPLMKGAKALRVAPDVAWALTTAVMEEYYEERTFWMPGAPCPRHIQVADHQIDLGLITKYCGIPVEFGTEMESGQFEVT